MNSFAPCPQCNGHNIHIAEWYSEFSGDTEYYCVCDDCGYEDPDKFEEEYVAVDHWNRRVATGYLDGSDPTDGDYDKLQEDDWEADEIENPAGKIKWGDSDTDICYTEEIVDLDLLDSEYALDGLPDFDELDDDEGDE